MPTALSSKIRLALHAIKDAHGTIFRVEEIEMPIGLSDIRQTQIRDHDSLHGGIDPEGYFSKSSGETQWLGSVSESLSATAS